jgi:ATP-dependent DNA helicase RecG
MSEEGQEHDHKSIRYALGKHKDAKGLACDCVGFANAFGGVILVGIEDGHDQPPADQRVPDHLAETVRKRIAQTTVNIGTIVTKKTADNGGEYVEIRVHRNQQSVASTSDGRFFLRVADETHPLRGDDLTRLMTERGSFFWELQPVRRLRADQYDADKLAAFAEAIRASDRVSGFVKGKSDQELLEHYLFVRDGCLTHLGVLWVGRRPDRAALLYAPTIQCIKYDAQDKKVRKLVWVDYDLNPMEIIAAVWAQVPDWRESYELPAGLFRKQVPHYEEVVVRELLANALVHRPYTQQGDIFVNLYPDRLEVHNPGLLPIGVTPRNILHKTVQRNPHLATVFYDLELMEREGSGFDKMYEVLLASGRPAPEVREGEDRVVVIVRKQILKPEIIDFMIKADQAHEPTQKELIALGLIAQQESLTAVELGKKLSLRNAEELGPWIGRLRKWGLVSTRGRTKATEYYVRPGTLRQLEFKGTTTLRGIEKHRLRELVLRDLEIYGEASVSQIHARIGPEIPRPRVQRMLAELVDEGRIQPRGQCRGRKYLYLPGAVESGRSGT